MSYYDAISNGYDELHGEEQLHKMRVAYESIPILQKEDITILDVGCGTGLSSQVFHGYMTGIDPSAELLKQAPFQTYRGSGENLPFKDNSFDVIICFSAIHNFADPRKGIREMRRVAREAIIISIIKKSKYFHSIYKYFEKVFPAMNTLNTPIDIILYTDLRLANQ